MQAEFHTRTIAFLIAAGALFGAQSHAQITEIQPPPATVAMTVDTTHATSYSLPRTLFGTFLEPIGNSTYNGLWAEILENPSFEGGIWDTDHTTAMVLQRPQLRRASQLGVPLPWEPLDYAQGNRYEMHWGNAANSWRSLEIIGVPGQPTGILQKVYLPIHRELTYNGSLFAKHIGGPTQLTLQIRKHHASEVLAQIEIDATAPTWTEYKFSLTVAAGKLARLDPADMVVQVSGDERVEIDNVLLFPADAIHGLDPDVVKMAKAMHTPLVRFGGNFTSGYHWRDGIGPEQKRVSMRNIAWGIPEYNTFGTDEFLDFCTLIGARPQIALNLGSGTPEEAADWVKYVDLHFGSKNGGLLWELGNELWGTWNLGWPTLGQLPGRTLDFSRAVRQVDPNAKLIATGGDMDWFHNWNAAQLTDPPGTFNYLSTHFVVTTDSTKLAHPSADFIAQATFALPDELGRRLRQAQGQIDAAPAFAHRAHIAFTEWLYVAHRKDAPQFTNMGGAIGTAEFFNMLFRNADIVPISDMTGIMEFAGIWKKRGQVYASPAYYAFQMYAGADATRTVSVTNDGGSYTVRNGVSRLPEIANVPYLDTVATLNDSGDTLTIFIVNRNLTRDMATNVRLNGFVAGPVAEVETLDAPSLYDGNSEDVPEHVAIVRSTASVNGNHLHFIFPHESITVLTLKKKRQLRAACKDSPSLRVPDGFVDCDIAISSDIAEGLHDAAGPANFHALDHSVLPEPEVRSRVAGGKIADRGRYRLPLRPGGSDDFNDCANAVAIAFVADQMNANPVVAGLRLIHQDVERTAIFRDNGIHIAIVVDVARRHSATDPALLKQRAGNGGNIDEVLPVDVPRHQEMFPVVDLREGEIDIVEIVSLGDQQVLPSIVVVVGKSNAPAGMQQCHAAKSAHVAGIAECAVA